MLRPGGVEERTSALTATLESEGHLSGLSPMSAERPLCIFRRCPETFVLGMSSLRLVSRNAASLLRHMAGRPPPRLPPSAACPPQFVRTELVGAPGAIGWQDFLTQRERSGLISRQEAP